MTQQRCIDPLYVGTCWDHTDLKWFTLPCPKRCNIKTLRKSYVDLCPLGDERNVQKRGFKSGAPKRAYFFKVTIQRLQIPKSPTQDPQSKIEHPKSEIQDLKSRIQSPELQDPRSIIRFVQHVFCSFFFMVFQDDAMTGSPEMAY